MKTARTSFRQALASPPGHSSRTIQDILIIILLIATVLSFFLGHQLEAVAIAVIVLFAVGMGFVQEYRAERAIEALREMAAPTATVIRDGEEQEIPAREVVPATCSWALAIKSLRTCACRKHQPTGEESGLTGESVPVEKQTAPLKDKDLATGDRTNMAYAGTVVTYGRGRGVVTATAMTTEFGKIARMLEAVETGKTPLPLNLDKVVISLRAWPS